MHPADDLIQFVIGSLKRVRFDGGLHEASGKHFEVLPAKFGMSGDEGAVGESYLEQGFKLIIGGLALQPERTVEERYPSVDACKRDTLEVVRGEQDLAVENMSKKINVWRATIRTVRTYSGPYASTTITGMGSSFSKPLWAIAVSARM